MHAGLQVAVPIEVRAFQFAFIFDAWLLLPLLVAVRRFAASPSRLLVENGEFARSFAVLPDSFDFLRTWLLLTFSEICTFNQCFNLFSFVSRREWLCEHYSVTFIHSNCVNSIVLLK